MEEGRPAVLSIEVLVSRTGGAVILLGEERVVKRKVSGVAIAPRLEGTGAEKTVTLTRRRLPEMNKRSSTQNQDLSRYGTACCRYGDGGSTETRC